MPVELIVSREVKLQLRIVERKDEGAARRWTGLHIRKDWIGGDLWFYMNLGQFRQSFMGAHDAQSYTVRGMTGNYWAVTRHCHLWTRLRRQRALE
jgi:hypothetical protein